MPINMDYYQPANVFRISGTNGFFMPCNTYVKESGNLIIYVRKKMYEPKVILQPNHKQGTLKEETQSFMMANCVNCHMPVGASKNLTLLVSRDRTPSPELVRSHLIAIY